MIGNSYCVTVVSIHSRVTFKLIKGFNPYKYKQDLRPAQQEEEAVLAQGKHARQHRTATAAARVLSVARR